ncbi:putative disease resistance protein RGA1 [Durio zibethinus]|uniref:Disease resistance protein RGA1 n=1 Tax=Durio zibethinus TaxID=66656 RepID=A0A6P5X338_DURZI|nr:putative disease resistance protein RGA1 [Durio zibethinus]
MGFKDELNKLRGSLTMAHAFLHDVETRQLDEPIQVWLKQLRKIAREADDVLDELAYEDLRRKVETQMRKKINDRALKFGLQQRVPTLPPLSRGSQATHSFVDSSQVVVREADVSKIIDLLIGSSTRQTFSIISIVGMGCLGKTTLAKSVCNNERTRNYFNKIMWVCVSENFYVQRILQEMLESLTGQTCDMKNRDAILEKIRNELEGKTYLLALDDVWDEDFRTWEDLRSSLLGINENKRSSILVTTRNENVAVVRATPHENRYHLMPLIDDECWAIIKNRAFQNSSIPQELEAIGRDIARGCVGVPLVANVIGGTMCNKRDIGEWVSLRDSPIWCSLKKNEGIVRVLKLSFDRLPSSSLKQCLAYCSNFPKDFMIDKEQLIQLWMAEGFLQQPEGNFQLAFEDIGNEYFNGLLSNSLLQDVEKDLLGCITGCKMHDLVHDLAQSIRTSETDNTMWYSLFSNSSFLHNVADFKGLRVLNFCDAYISSLSESIGRLKHLRYFDISNTRIDRLPKIHYSAVPFADIKIVDVPFSWKTS